MTRIQDFIESNRDELSQGRHWYGEGTYSEDVVDASPLCALFTAAYWDYFNNGGANRDVIRDSARATRALGVLRRGSLASRCLSFIASYGGDDWGPYMPDDLDPLFDTVLDALVEEQFRRNEQEAESMAAALTDNQ